MTDRWGVDIGGAPSSIDAWNRAWDRFLHFTGDPVELLADANELDDEFAMGSIIAGTYAVLSGSPLDDAELRLHVDRAADRATSDIEGEHVEALHELVAGDFTAAGVRWAELGAEELDFAAARFAHDVFLHVGEAYERLDWSEQTLVRWSDEAGRSFLEGMHAFALNELGRFDEARDFGLRALLADPLDLWARHALAHVYEDTDDTEAALALLADTIELWAGQDQLALHVWWHLALRQLADGEIEDVLTIYDAQLDDATTAFRLCDLTSLLWRLELAGHDVGSRWDVLANRWALVTEIHTCGFLDLHAALAFDRRPDHAGAEVFRRGLAERPVGDAEIDEIFDDVVRPLIDAVERRDAEALDALAPLSHRIGGSNAQRRILGLTAEAFR